MRRAVCLAIVATICGCLVPSSSLGQESPAPIEHVSSATTNEISSVEAVWPRGEVREYLFRIAGQQVGRQWNQLVVQAEADSGLTYELNFKLDLDLSAVGQPTRMQMEGELALSSEGVPLSYGLEVSFDEEKQKLTATFTEDTVLAAVTKGGRTSQHSVPYSPDIFVVDNNMIGQWGFMLGLLPLKVGQEIPQKIFVPQALMEMDILVEVTGEETVQVNGSQEQAYICQIAPIGEICWITRSGRLVRLEDKKQSLVVTLVSPEGEMAPAESSEHGFFLRTLLNRAVGYLIYLLVALAWLAILSAGRMGRWDLWMLLVVGGIIFPVALGLQVPLQRAYLKWAVMPRMQQGISALLWGIGTVALSGILQELFKFLPVFFRLRFTSPALDHRKSMALGAAVGIGFGLLEAILLTGKALALGIVSPWAIFERAFAILFHGAVGSIVAWGIWKRSSLRYYLLATLLHSLGNYSVILFHQHLLSPAALELSVAAFDLGILAYALVIMRRGARDLAVEEMSAQEV
ncbi:MAG: hypothetical protein AMJ92_10950 [candidate division Zixibacteria bacterium SM23_81]|nr:MAG: hypothetical protein AMJ92_10950 [candidate division Zixibacteria bacterium SM23_81]